MNLKKDTEGVIHQVCDLLHRMDDEMFTQSLEVFSDSSIGSHIRHIHGFYACLIHGAESGVVNYDKRERDLRVETETIYCDENFCSLVPRISELDLQQPVTVLQGMYTSDQAIDSGIASSIGRELIYTFEHAVHHLAIVKMGLRVHFPDFEVDENLGVAPSTIEYRQSVCAQ